MQFLENIPRKAYFIAVPVLLFAATVAVTMAMSGGDDNGPSLAVVTQTPSLDNIDAPATATASPTATRPAAPTSTPEPTAGPAPNREDCDAIRGTDYQSPSEREWYLANCLGGGQTATGGGGGGDGGGGGGGTSPSGPAVTGGGEFALGDRLIIPSIGADGAVNGVVVPPSGAMPDPVGYFNFVWYDFANFGGLGGNASSGNYVVGCHVDSAVYGAVLCYNVRYLGGGEQIQLVTASGAVQNYTVVSSVAYSAQADFSGIVAAGTADLTIITCTGTFSGGSYDQRHVVQAVRS